MNARQRRVSARQIKTQAVSKTVEALTALGNEALGMLNVPPVTAEAPTPIRRIENKILVDVLGSELALLRNEGWSTVHFQFVNNEHGLPVLAVVLERVVEVAPPSVREPVAQVEAGWPIPNFADTQKVEMPIEILDAEPHPEPSLLDKLKGDKPIFAAIAEHGVDAVTDALDAEVLQVARKAYDNALAGMDRQPTRFESKLLSPFNPPASQGEVSVESDLVVEAVLP